jgi:hypothetical protein
MGGCISRETKIYSLSLLRPHTYRTIILSLTPTGTGEKRGGIFHLTLSRIYERRPALSLSVTTLAQ